MTDKVTPSGLVMLVALRDTAVEQHAAYVAAVRAARAAGVSVVELAGALGVSRQAVYGLLRRSEER